MPSGARRGTRRDAPVVRVFSESGKPQAFQPLIRCSESLSFRLSLLSGGVLLFSDTGVERLSYVFVVGFLLFSTPLQNYIGISPEFHQSSLEFHQNVELKHLTKGDNHNSGFPQTPAVASRVLRS